MRFFKKDHDIPVTVEQHWQSVGTHVQCPALALLGSLWPWGAAMTGYRAES